MNRPPFVFLLHGLIDGTCEIDTGFRAAAVHECSDALIQWKLIVAAGGAH